MADVTIADVTIGEKSMKDDFGAYLQTREISFPEMKQYTIEVPGRDGVLDFTEAFGEVKYNNRLLNFTFVVEDVYNYNPTLMALANHLHGSKYQIRITDDPDYHYYGRCKITSFSVDQTIGFLEIECDCDPYKYKNDVTSTGEINITTSTQTIPLVNNGRMRIMPKIVVIADPEISDLDVEINYNPVGYQEDENNPQYSLTVHIGEGETIITDLQLITETKHITITGSDACTINFIYQEGDL